MLGYLFLALALIVRFLLASNVIANPWWNFTPVAASLLFFGAYRSKREWIVPVIAFAAADIVLTKFVYHYALTLETFVSTLFYVAALGLGLLLQKKQTALRIAGASLAGSFTFFVISNFAVWVAYDTYAHTLAGLLQCYIAAIPFYRNNVAADLVYSAVMFGTPVAIHALRKAFATPARELAA
jgi:hypothetical protein